MPPFFKGDSMATYEVNGEKIDIQPSDVVKCRVIAKGYDGIELREAGQVINLSGKFFQSNCPSWVEIEEVFEAKKELVEQIVVGTKKGRAK